MVVNSRLSPSLLSLNHRPAAEREYIFDHAWQQVKEKFYDVNLHGVDWDYYRKTYRKVPPPLIMMKTS